MDAGDQPLVGDVEERHARRLVDAAALGLDDPVLDLVRHAQAVAAADDVGLGEQRQRRLERAAVELDRLAVLEADPDGLRRYVHVCPPRGHAHDRVDDRHALVQELEVLGLVGGAQDVRVGGVRLVGAHPVLEAGAVEVGGHLGTAAQLVDEGLVQPRLVDPQLRVDEQPVAVEPLDVVALVGAAVTPDVDVVLLHRRDEHRPGDRSSERRRVEVQLARRRDVEGAGLQGGDALGDELRPALDQARPLGAVCQRLARDRLVVVLVGLAEVGGVGVGDCAVLAHPVQGGAGVEPAGERDADPLADGEMLEDVRHGAGPSAWIGRLIDGAVVRRGGGPWALRVRAAVRLYRTDMARPTRR